MSRLSELQESTLQRKSHESKYPVWLLGMNNPSELETTHLNKNSVWLRGMYRVASQDSSTCSFKLSSNKQSVLLMRVHTIGRVGADTLPESIATPPRLSVVEERTVALLRALDACFPPLRTFMRVGDIDRRDN